METKRRKSRIWDVKNEKMRYQSEWSTKGGAYHHKLVMDLEGHIYIAWSVSDLASSAYHIHDFHDSVDDQDRYVWMYSTGCQDKNDKEIYESDIMRHSDIMRCGGNVGIYVVEWWSIQWHVGFDVREISDQAGTENPLTQSKVFPPVWKPEKWEIIGNLYEYPGLNVQLQSVSPVELQKGAKIK